MKKLLLVISLLFFGNVVISQIVNTKSFYYHTSSTNLSEKNKMELINFIKSHNFIDSLIITGYADTVGSINNNLALSANRANQIKKLIIQKGLVINNIITRAFGEKRQENLSTDADLQLSRKVRVDIYFSSTTTIKDLYAKLAPPPVEFTIYPNRDTILLSKKRTVLIVKAGSFNTKSNSPITLKIDEFFTKAEMIAGNLSTTSNNKILVSGGMVNIEAFQESVKLSNNLKNEIQIRVPTAQKDELMKTFYGSRDAAHNINWNNNANVLGVLGTSDFSCNCDSTVVKYRSNYCDSLLRLDDNDLKVHFNFFQKIFYSKEKKGRAEEEKIKLISDKISCNRKYSQAKKDSAIKFDELRLPECKIFCEQKKVQDRIKDMSKEVWEKNIENAINSKIENDSANSSAIDITDLNYYIFNSSQIGYINIDKFFNYSGPRINITASPSNSSTDFKLIFKDFKSILPSTYIHGKFEVINIPVNYSVILFGLQYINGQAKVYYEEVTTSQSKTFYEMDFKSVSLDELKSILNKLNN